MREKDLNEAVALKGQIDFLVDRSSLLTTIDFDVVTPGVDGDPTKRMDLLAAHLGMDNSLFREVSRQALMRCVNDLIQERRQALKKLGVRLDEDDLPVVIEKKRTRK